MLDLVYLALKKRLTEKVPALDGIDWHLNQYAQVGDDSITITPGLYIKFLPIDWKTMPDNIQRGVLVFETHLVSDTAYGDERDMTDKDYIDHLGTESKVFQALMNFRFLLSYVPGYESFFTTANDRVLLESIVRVSSVPHGELDNIAKTNQRFQAVMYDYSAQPQWQTVVAALECEVIVGSPTVWQDSQGNSYTEEDLSPWLGED
jgi:hypothetical protein